MAIYVWGCKNCGKQAEVMRNPSQMDVAPDEPCCENPDRERLLPTGTGAAFGKNWAPTSWKDGKGGKGSW
jgi:predicted nucleic acid-binding Zn ribbon protein